MGNTILGKPYAPFSKDILQQQLVCSDRLWFIVLQTTRGKDESNIVLLVFVTDITMRKSERTDTNRTTHKITQKAKYRKTRTDIRPFLIALRYSLTFIYSCMFLCGNLFNLLFSMLCFVDHCLSCWSSCIICPSSIYGF